MVDAAKTEAAKRAGDGPNQAVLVVDLGKHSRKRLKRLRQGEGQLMDEVAETIRRLREAGEIEANVTPLVFIAREKEEAPSLPWGA